MGIQLPSVGKETASASIPIPSEEGAHRLRVIFYCVDEGREPALSPERNWQSSEQFFPMDTLVFLFSDEVRAQYERGCTGQTHHIDYEVTVVKAEAS
ncbi:hypothetical protein HY948_00685 [Candidatus Gottesmanbacteria bacterium]|nr:hypothetical protein [Candidatus Gottesmanbacteria bacterium]